MAGSIDEVQLVFVSVGCGEEHTHGMGLDGDPAFLFQVHGVQKLGVDEVALFDRVGDLEHAVGKRRFPVVDMRDDGEIADAGQVIHGLFLWILKRGEGVSRRGNTRRDPMPGRRSRAACGDNRRRGSPACA